LKSSGSESGHDEEHASSMKTIYAKKILELIVIAYRRQRGSGGAEPMRKFLKNRCFLQGIGNTLWKEHLSKYGPPAAAVFTSWFNARKTRSRSSKREASIFRKYCWIAK